MAGKTVHVRAYDRSKPKRKAASSPAPKAAPARKAAPAWPPNGYQGLRHDEHGILVRVAVGSADRKGPAFAGAWYLVKGSAVRNGKVTLAAQYSNNGGPNPRPHLRRTIDLASGRSAIKDGSVAYLDARDCAALAAAFGVTLPKAAAVAAGKATQGRLI